MTRRGRLPLDSREEGRELLLSTIERKGILPDTGRGDLLQGTLDLLVLKALHVAPMHGWGITERIQQWSNEVLQVNQGSLYPALTRLEKRGLIRAEWRTTENNRQARYYSLTAAGRRELAAERAHWERLSQAVNLVLRVTG